MGGSTEEGVGRERREIHTLLRGNAIFRRVMREERKLEGGEIM